MPAIQSLHISLPHTLSELSICQNPMHIQEIQNLINKKVGNHELKFIEWQKNMNSSPCLKAKTNKNQHIYYKLIRASPIAS